MPVGAVNTAPVLKVKLLFATKVVNAEASKVPAIMIAPLAVRPVALPKPPSLNVSTSVMIESKPVIDEPAFIVKVPLLNVRVPLPLNVPAKVTEFGIVGLEPRGNKQVEVAVFAPV